MSDLKISQLTDGNAAQATDEFVVARSGGNFRIDGASVAAAATSVGTLSSLTVSGDLTVDTSTLKVDSTANSVGIGTTTLKTYSGYNSLTLGNNGSGGILAFRSSYNSGNGAEIYQNSSGILLFNINSALTGMALDASGNLGLGVTPSAWASGYKALQFGNSSTQVAGLFSNNTNDSWYLSNAYFNGSSFVKIASGTATAYEQQNGQHIWYNAAAGTGTFTFTQAMTLDASGNLSVGTATALLSAANRGNITINGSDAILTLGVGASAKAWLYANSSAAFLSTVNNPLVFETNSTERARITSGGDFFVGKTSDTLSAVGHALNASGGTTHTRSGDVVVLVNRLASDGDLMSFWQDTTQEGSISVSGNTVSYNAFAGSHWSQLEDGSKPEILRGTVMEAINELCEWPDEQNERLPKAKVSDTAGSKKVYGVFMAWDNDWTATNDMYVTAVGAFICRVAADVVVEQGDLLESNGDGTARVQADDVIRSSTIGKVTSTVKTHEYEDGTYCVPTVLYCG